MALLVRPAATHRRMATSRSVRQAGLAGRRRAACRRAERLAGLLTAAGAEQRGDQRGPQDAEQGPILVGEIAVAPAQGHADHLLIGARQADGDLVLDGYAAEELGVDAQSVESVEAEKIADHHRFARAGGAVVVDQRVLVHVGREDRLGRRVEPAGRVVGVACLARGWPDFVVGNDVAAHQPG